MTADLVQFLRDRLAEEIRNERHAGHMLVTAGVEHTGLPRDVAEERARLLVHAVEVRQALFEETVRPYLGTAGPTGRIAEQQLRLMASGYEGHSDYREEFRP